jgi:tRNA modification GTPase
MKWKTEDTIAAVSTPPGAGGVGMIRVSGSRAAEIVGGLFRPTGRTGLAEAPSHLMLHGWIEDEGQGIDEVLVVHMKAPHSYTREDVVEVHGHGGTVAVRAILELICARGARLAEAGEFTFRAFVNGRLDLTQAEAVGDVVRAGSRLGLRVAANQLRGRLHDAIRDLRSAVAHVAALVNASIDFPEEDARFTQRDDCTRRLEAVRDRLDALLREAGRGRQIREGLGVAIVGKPNVGKSSLLNALLRENRAIVTDLPGTTRDTLEERLELDGLGVRLIDTAGIRHTEDRVEREGIARSRAALAEADLALIVLDASRPLDSEDRALLALASPARALIVANKQDLADRPGSVDADELRDYEQVPLSALTGAGLQQLETRVRGWVLQGGQPVWESAALTNARQQQAAARARGAVTEALRTLNQGLGEELLAVDLALVLDALGDIVGETTAEDLLDRIFAEFCIGK